MNLADLPDLKTRERLLRELVGRQSDVSPCKVDRPLVLYGAGSLGVLAADLFERLKIPIAYALDRRPPADGLLNGRIPVLTPEQAPEADRMSHRLAFSIVNFPFKPARKTLVDMGWKHITPVYDILDYYSDRLPMRNGWFSGSLSNEDTAKIHSVLGGWHDDRSRAAYLQVLAWRILRREWFFDGAPVTVEDRYFIPPVTSVLHSHECFLDAGAYRGDVLRKFITITKGAFGKILAIEPDRENRIHLRKNVDSLAVSVSGRIGIQEVALGAVEGTGAYSHGMGIAARLLSEEGADVRIARLDNLDFPVSFAKIHLEGGELEALRGGLAFLRRNRPLLAITAYHNRDGLWRIPDLLMNSLQDYRFLTRLHAWCGTGCAIYAIPMERCNSV